MKSSMQTPSSVQLDGRPRLWRLALAVLKAIALKDSMNGFQSVIEIGEESSLGICFGLVGSTWLE